jgi:DMSO reductase anchor subunit
MKNIKWLFILLVFVLPLLLLSMGLNQASLGVFLLAFVSQYIGLLAERWFFFAQANHPQNLYYQTI